MLNADQAPHFKTCPRCGTGGLETLRTHSFCVDCNYEEIYSDELCVVPQWALDVLKPTKAKSVVREPSANKEELPLKNAV